MFYIEENSFDRQVELISEIAKKNEFELVVWLCPESALKNIIGESIYSSTKINAFPVTTYERGIIPQCTQRLRLTDDLISKLAQEKELIALNADSLCIYDPYDSEWQACVIFHENIIIIKAPSLMDNLDLLNFNVMPHAPSWW